MFIFRYPKLLFWISEIIIWFPISYRSHKIKNKRSFCSLYIASLPQPAMVIEILLLVACVCCDVCYRCKTVAAIATKLSVQTGKVAMDHSPGGSTLPWCAGRSLLWLGPFAVKLFKTNKTDCQSLSGLYLFQKSAWFSTITTRDSISL